MRSRPGDAGAGATPSSLSMHPGIAPAAAALRGAARPLLCCHRSPDGDTVGAAVALAMALGHLGIVPTVACPDPLPTSLSFVPHSETVGTTLPPDADLLVTIDTSDPGMLGALREGLWALRPGRTLLNIDHHASDGEYGDVNLVDVSAASTAEIVYDLIGALGVAIDRDMATALLAGIINDTHSFQNSNTTPRVLATAAALVEAGADAAAISYHLLLRRRPQAALLWGQTLATMRLDDGGRVASAVATNAMVAACGAEPTDLDGVVEFLRGIDGVDLAFLLKPVANADGHFKVSARTTERVDAVELTRPFGGGGHRRAAGCDIAGPPDAAREALLQRYHELIG